MKAITRKTISAIAASGVIAGAVTFVGSEEGLRTKAYRDAVGKPTICYGETRGVSMGDEKAPEDCEHMLATSLNAEVHKVDMLSHRHLPDEMRVALASFRYNVGPDAFARSTLLLRLASGDYEGACNEMPKWVYAGHGEHRRAVPGLIERRKAEQELCLIGARKMKDGHSGG